MAGEHELVESFGGTWTDEDAQSIIGYDLLEAAVVIRERGGVDLEPDEIVERLLDGVIARVREHVPWRPGARRLLSELNALGVPCALVTMSWSPARRRRSSRRWRRSSSRPSSPATTSSTASPIPSRTCWRPSALGVDPVQCVAIEDSPTGVASASAAGCVVVAVPNIVPIDPAPGRFIVSTLKGIEPGDLGLLVATTPETDGQPRASPSAGATPSSSRARRGARSPLVAVVVALALRRDDDDQRRGAAAGAAADPCRRARVDAVLGARGRPRRSWRRSAPTMAQLSPFWWVATDVESIEVQPNTPADEAEQFLETARELGVPLVASILDGTEPGVMAEILADPDQRSRHVDTIVAFADDGDFARHRHRLRAVRLRRRARHLGIDTPELGRLRRGARRPPARRRADPDRQRPARLRRRADRRQRVLGLRLRARSRRTSTPSA